MDYPRTDEEWEKLAECIVTKDAEVPPERVGALTVDATATIFSWYIGGERTKALSNRQYARDVLVRLAKEAGCLEEHEEIKMSGKMMEVPLGGEEQHYWEVTNMVTGQVLQEDVYQRTIAEAVHEAQFAMDTKYTYFGDNHLVIKIFDRRPFDRTGLTIEPEYTVSYWVEGAARRGDEVLDRISQTLTPDRPVPQTYGDWVNLGVDIKEKVGIDDFFTTGQVNTHLGHIYREEELDPEAVRESKMWLTRKAGELGIK